MLVVCLCAAWCDVCNDFEGIFAALASEFPQARFVWVDIEDQAGPSGDIEVENFPSLAVFRREEPLFFGTCPPQRDVVRRLLHALGEPGWQRVDVPAEVAALPRRLTSPGAPAA